MKAIPLVNVLCSILVEALMEVGVTYDVLLTDEILQLNSGVSQTSTSYICVGVS